MQVKLASKRGFCFGVEDAIELAETTLAKRAGPSDNPQPPQPLYALGPLIHNNQVCDKLADRGLLISELDNIPDGQTVLIRSHGVNPETYDAINARRLNYVDATCVLVKKAQNCVRQLHEEGYQVVMVGDPNHAEVKGVLGYAPGIICVETTEDVHKVPKFGKLGIVAQTTHSAEYFSTVVAAIIAQRPFREIKIVNTLCLEVVRRQQAALELAKEVDVMFVLGGLHSANTKEMARLVRDQTGVPTYHLETWEQFEREMIAGCQTAGVTAGASTPEWVIEEFVSRLKALSG